MVHILGVNLPDNHLARYALTSFYGVGHKTSHRLCARFQIHDKCKVKDLSPFQVTSLASFLSSPGTAPPLPRYPLAPPKYTPPPPANTPAAELQAQFRQAQAASAARKQKRAAAEAKQLQQQQQSQQQVQPQLKKAGGVYVDPLKGLKIESELRREIRENIAHQRMIGSYVGRRHAMHLPVRGQNTQSNAKTAKKLNKMDRW